MMNADEYLYQNGLLEFEIGNYEKSMEYFIECYKTSDRYREQIVENIYGCFVLPNQDEFKNNFGKIKTSDYDNCAIDFIPVTETKFYVFNKNTCWFEKPIDISGLKNEPVEMDIRSIFISDNSDIASIIELVGLKKWNGIYLLDDGENEVINSLYKLPGFAEFLKEKIVIFKNLVEAEKYFRTNDEKYLPKLILSDEKDSCEKLFEKLHKERLSKKTDTVRPLLSICIPTYNRGSSALEGVKHVLQSSLDYEIEVFVTDNGSTEGVEGYKEIAQIEDSRLRYFRFDKNMEYFGNIENCLKMAKGQFAMIVSDEDFVINENLINYINFLMKHRHIAGFNYWGEYEVKEKGVEAAFWGTNNNYVSGLTFNMDYVQHSLATVLKNRENYYCKVYIHCAIMAGLGAEYDLCKTAIPMIKKGKEASFNSGDDQETKMLSYTTYDSRVKQMDEFAKYLDCITEDEDLKRGVILRFIPNIFGILVTAKGKYPDKMNYINVCVSLYNHIKSRIQEKYCAYSTLNNEACYEVLKETACQYLVLGGEKEMIIGFIERVGEMAKEYEVISGLNVIQTLEKVLAENK